MRDLTRRQRQVLEYVTACIQEQGYPPTIREIARHLGLRSSNGVANHLRALERKGYLARSAGKSRGLRPLGASGRTVTVPFLDGADTDPSDPQSSTRQVSLDRLLVGPANDLFVLRTHAEMTLCEGLSVGDFLVVSRSVRPGLDDMVVSTQDGRIVVERLSEPPPPPAVRTETYMGLVQAVFRRF